ncbi:MAG: ATP-binding protein [Candidatus Nitrosopolaris sp.]
MTEINHDYKAAHKNAPPQTEQGSTTTSSSTFSSQKTVMDYVILEDIENRTGIEKNDMCGFVLKELLDNALDFLETQYKGQKNYNTIVPAEIEVAIKKEANYLCIVVRNSNYYGNVIFTKDQLHAIFDFDTFYSSKRNQYKISRGALGDAFKAVLCIPYALA